MPTVVFSKIENNGKATLASGIAAAATSAIATTAVSLKVDGYTGADATYATFITEDTYRTEIETLETVKITAVSGNVLTITRAQGGTTAIAFEAGAIIELRPVDAQVEEIQDTLTDGTDDIAPGGVAVGGDLTLAAAGVDKLWNKWLPSPMWLPDTAGALVQAIYQAGDIEVPVIPFTNGLTEESECQVMLPADYDGSALKFEIFWSTSAGTAGDVLWKLWVAAFETGNTLALVTSPETYAVQSFGAQKQLKIAGKSATPNGAADGSRLLSLRMQRNGAAGSDTFDANAEFIGMNISYT